MQWKDILGKKFGKLTVIGNFEGIRTKWVCRCECGVEIVSNNGALSSGNTKSCGCSRRLATIKRNTTHGMSALPEYKVWKGMLKRCFNKNDKRHKDYAARGISVHPDFVKDFPAWFNEVGSRPKTGERWSIGRIDNNAWYTYGNMRWELDYQQAQNHSKQANNTSGITGIQFQRKIIAGNTYTNYVACWAAGGKKKTKNFSADKFGDVEAKNMAIKYRDDKIKELNSYGAEYMTSHGDDK